VLENAETWGFYYSGPTTAGVLYGTSTGSGSTFNATGTDFNFYTRTYSTGSLTGTVVPGSSISSRSTTTGGTISLIYDPSYNTPASLSAVAGNYTGWGVTKSTASSAVTFAISSSGAISAAGVNCVVSGTVTPRASGKNVYNVSTTFTGSGCAIGSLTTTGVAVLTSSGGFNRLIMMTLNGAKTDGYILNGYSSGSSGGIATVPAQSAVINWTKAANNQIFNLYTTNGCLGTLTQNKSNGTSQSAVFEGVSRPYSTITSNLSYSNCTPASTTGVEQSFTDTNYIPFGYSISSGAPANNAFYGLYASTPNIPVSITAGASGSVGTVNRYTDSTKTVSAGRSVVTFTSSAETTTSLLLNLVNTVYDATNNLTYTEIDTYRITTSGVATLLGGQITYANGVVAYFR
jgi:hypothetical protein